MVLDYTPPVEWQKKLRDRIVLLGTDVVVYLDGTVSKVLRKNGSDHANRPIGTIPLDLANPSRRDELHARVEEIYCIVKSCEELYGKTPTLEEFEEQVINTAMANRPPKFTHSYTPAEKLQKDRMFVVLTMTPEDAAFLVERNFPIKLEQDKFVQQKYLFMCGMPGQGIEKTDLFYAPKAPSKRAGGYFLPGLFCPIVKIAGSFFDGNSQPFHNVYSAAQEEKLHAVNEEYELYGKNLSLSGKLWPEYVKETKDQTKEWINLYQKWDGNQLVKNEEKQKIETLCARVDELFSDHPDYPIIIAEYGDKKAFYKAFIGNLLAAWDDALNLPQSLYEDLDAEGIADEQQAKTTRIIQECALFSGSKEKKVGDMFNFMFPRKIHKEGKALYTNPTGVYEYTKFALANDYKEKYSEDEIKQAKAHHQFMYDSVIYRMLKQQQPSRETRL